tara:strand:- start:206 stop:460 length:255 start_codon:yes stop_codon:yes gene_type:complete
MGGSISKILSNFDITSIFKDKRFGDLKRWSAKRTIGGVIVAYALSSMNGVITYEGLIMIGIGVLPLCLSMFEGRGKSCNNCKCK